MNKWWDSLDIWERAGVLFMARTPSTMKEVYGIKSTYARKSFAELGEFLQLIITNFYQDNISNPA